jgi:hypothetical protein
MGCNMVFGVIMVLFCNIPQVFIHFLSHICIFDCISCILLPFMVFKLYFGGSSRIVWYVLWCKCMFTPLHRGVKRVSAALGAP